VRCSAVGRFVGVAPAPRISTRVGRLPVRQCFARARGPSRACVQTVGPEPAAAAAAAAARRGARTATARRGLAPTPERKDRRSSIKIV
jgi:hypothetical protein